MGSHMKHHWKQGSLFPEEASATVDIRLSLNQEAQALGIGGAVYIGKRTSSESEIVSWHNYTANGVASALRSIVELIQETEEHHGLCVDVVDVNGDSSPF